MTDPPSPIDEPLRNLLGSALGLPRERVAGLDDQSPLFGALPELDSMALAGLLAEIEDRFAITVHDEEVSGALFETFGSLRDYIASKVEA